MLKRKVAEVVAKQVVKQVLRAAVGGPVVKVADIVSKPLQILGSAIGEYIAQQLRTIRDNRIKDGLKVYDVEVELSGEFEGEYMLEDFGDLESLPLLLALLPESESEDDFMGKSVLNDIYVANMEFILFLRNVELLRQGTDDLGASARLEIEVDL